MTDALPLTVCYGKSNGQERYLNLGSIGESACKNKVGTSEGKDGGVIVYAAYGSRGCHTYLDYYPDTSTKHGDRITGAWKRAPRLPHKIAQLQSQAGHKTSPRNPWGYKKQGIAHPIFESASKYTENKRQRRNQTRNKYCEDPWGDQSLVGIPVNPFHSLHSLVEI